MANAREAMRGNGAIHATNRAAFLLALRDSGVLSVAELAKLTGLSRPTTQAALTQLEEEAWVTQVNDSTREAGQLGRPKRRYCFNAEAGYLVGLDVGPHRMRGAIANLTGQIVTANRVEFEPLLDGQARIEQIAGFLQNLVESIALDLRQIQIVVIASTGIVSADGDIVLSSAIPEWTGINLGAKLYRYIPLNYLLENDINMAALAEHKLGVAQGADNVAFIHIGNRMNAGFILHGELYRGATFSAGEVADIAESPWDDGGGAEDWIRVGSILESGVSLDDPDARKELEAFSRRVSAPLAVVTSAIDPNLIVIGGAFSDAHDDVVDLLRSEVSRLVPRRNTASMRASALGTCGALSGALVRAFQVADQENFGIARLPLNAKSWISHIKELE